MSSMMHKVLSPPSSEVCSPVRNMDLIRAFQDSITGIKDYLGSYLFILTDAAGVLLDMEHSKDMEQAVNQSPLRTGMSFNDRSIGTNAITEAMRRNAPVYLSPLQHESPLLRSWHCFSTPLFFKKRCIGYLDVSTINSHLKRELIAVTKLLPQQLMNLYQERHNTMNQEASCSIQLTDRQLDVLRLISGGLTVKAIAITLRIRECTVNHHKKVIFEKLGVQTSTEAIMKASKLSWL